MAHLKRLMSQDEPSPNDLDAIEAEWPVIAAELAITDIEIAAARAGDALTELDRRRMRRSNAARLRSAAASARWGGLDGAA